MVKVGINGFGRIGRIAYRIGNLKHGSELEFAAINTSGSMEVSGWAHITNYDTMYRKFEKLVGAEETKKAEQEAAQKAADEAEPTPVIAAETAAIEEEVEKKIVKESERVV